MKTIGAGLAIGFGVALAIVVGNRMSSEAMAVIIGIVCGVAASIPASAIVLLATGRTRGATTAPMQPVGQRAIPDGSWRSMPPDPIETAWTVEQPEEQR